jgi:hypothetical protein
VKFGGTLSILDTTKRKTMSHIEDKIAAENKKSLEEAEKKEHAAQVKRNTIRAAWVKWVKEEQPRIAEFKKEIEKCFPCLGGDFAVMPRNNPIENFTALITVCKATLEIRKLNQNSTIFTLFIPYETSSFYGREKHLRQYDLESDTALKNLVSQYILDRAYAEARAQEYYDSLPIGNTD